MPAEPLQAAAEFQGRIVPMVLAEVQGGARVLTLCFPPADHAHGDWRRALVATLARSIAPARINGLAADDEAAMAASLAWVEAAEGVTGQYFVLDGQGAGKI